MGGIRSDRQREPDEAVGAELQGDRRQDDGAAGGRLDVGVGQPGMDRPHRYLDGKGDEESEEKPDLGAGAMGSLCHSRISKLPLDWTKRVHQGDQEQQRAEEGVEEELEGGIDPVRDRPRRR